MEDIESILEEREKTHGNYRNVAATYRDVTDAINIKNFEWCAKSDPSHKSFALQMIAGKISRIVNGNSDHLDHWKDIAGYAMLVVKEIEKDN